MVQGIASETGEVVVLTTVEQASGDTATTRLWVVEHDNTLWLRGSASVGLDTTGPVAKHSATVRARRHH